MSRQNETIKPGNGEDYLLESYVREISSYAPLSDEEEARLSELILSGDAKAKDKLVKANLKFVVSIARQYATESVSMLDLIDEGNIALIKAADKFDAKHGQRFSNYAVWQIRKAMEAACPDAETIMKRPDMDTVSKSAGSAEEYEDGGLSHDEMLEVIGSLPERERLVLKAVYGVGSPQMTLAEIGQHYDMKRERVRQIRNRALRRLQSMRKKI